MSQRTQISGGYGVSRGEVFPLKEKLERINVNVTHPIGDGSIFSKKQILAIWSPYEIYLDYYQAIASSDFHIAYNNIDGSIDDDTAAEIAFAMSKRKPIILLHPPRFIGVNKDLEQIIKDRLNNLVICDLKTLDVRDASVLINNLASKPISYMLSNQERGTIKQYMRSYFRELENSSGSKKYGIQ